MAKTLGYFFWLSASAQNFAILAAMEKQKRAEIGRRFEEVRHFIAKELAIDSAELNRLPGETIISESAQEELAFVRTWLVRLDPDFHWVSLPDEDKRLTDIAMPW